MEGNIAKRAEAGVGAQPFVLPAVEEEGLVDKSMSPNQRRNRLRAAGAIGLALAMAGGAGAVAPASAEAATTVPGHTDRYDEDNNGIPDEGVTVNGKYTSLYAYDAGGDWYWDLGDGRVQGTVDSVDDLEQATLTSCDYQVQYRGNFENDPFLDSGWIMNNINCKGYDDNGTYNYLIVNESDPRYTGDPDWAIWGTWEFHVLTESGSGNLTGPKNYQP